MTLADSKIIGAMLAYGGSFVKALARAYMAGDPDNQAKIRLAFDNLFRNYEEMAKNMAEPTP
jgi:hypothetical protein